MIWITALVAATTAAGLAWIGHNLWQGHRLDRSGGER